MPILGSTSTSGQASSFATTRSMVLTLPAIAGMVLESITVLKSGGAGRVSAYTGGTLDNPSGATLLEALTFPAGTGPTVNETVVSALRPALPSGGVLRVAIQTGGNFAVGLSDEAGKGDWYGPRHESSSIPGDLGTPMPATWPADSGTVGSTYPVVQVTYSVGAGGPPNTPPTVAITSPTAESVTVPSGTRLQVLATASDQQGTDIGSSIAWSSSNAADVPAGGWPAGGTLVIDTTGWANGQRTITANVTDAGGLQATPDSFTLAIGAGSTLILEDDVQQEILQSGTAATVRVALRDSTGAVLESNPLAPGDVKKSVDGGAPAVLAGDAGAAAWTVVNGFLNVPLTAAEVTGSEITLFIEDQDGSAYLDRAVKIMVVGYDPRATPASTTQIASAVGDALSARLAS